MQLITNFFTKIQIIVASHQKIVQWLLYLSIAIIVGGFSYTVFDRSTAPLWYNLGHQAANWSLITFLLTLIPGMIKRFDLKGPFTPIGATLMILRKEIGIVMFLLAFAHYGWSRALPTLVIDGNLLNISLFEQFGLVALIMAFPMFLT